MTALSPANVRVRKLCLPCWPLEESFLASIEVKAKVLVWLVAKVA
eukprot:CAMPEP_0171074756 /NCGR_PEP_ID=MMETSP0766_2-20121228/12348_1 /TAXON_ID=439317 /ORGANISM="Gambierdiscus australes, Strain CAWD 149" /LENGTH=44 /DNA_ID= /DNA_START= /DNA_END= /DNA_ORIENTATION=